MFNDYVEKRGAGYLESAMQKPKFLENVGKFNHKWVKNPKTRLILEKDSRYEYLLSVFIANLRKPKFASGLLNEAVANRFNSKIEELDKAIGDDWSFLEFSTIVKEEQSEPVITKADPDYVKAVHLLTKVFDPERKFVIGKSPINVIVINGGLLTNRIKEEADRLLTTTKTKTILVHAEDMHDRFIGANKDSIEKIIARFVVDNADLFEGYVLIDRLSMSAILSKLRPKYEPLSIHCESDTSSLQKELDGMSAIYSHPTGLMKSIKISMIKDINRKQYLKSIENDSYKDFCKLSPVAIHPYYKEIKSSFDKYTYNWYISKEILNNND